jgi:protein TonB
MPPTQPSFRVGRRAWPIVLALVVSLIAHGLLLLISRPTPSPSPAASSAPAPLSIVLNAAAATKTKTKPAQIIRPHGRHATTQRQKDRPKTARAVSPRHMEREARPRRSSLPRGADASGVVVRHAGNSAGGTQHLSMQDLLSQAVAGQDSTSAAPSAPPGRLVFGRSATGVVWQQYVEDWVRKMERIGAINYPLAVRQQGLTGGPVLTVVINADGSLAALHIVRSSGNATLDRAAENLVRLAAPFSPFPPVLAAQGNSLEIRRKWSFSTDNDLSVQ